MLQDAQFKICFILSAFIHLTLLSPWSFMQFTAKPEITFQKVELTYFKMGEVEGMIVKDLKPITSVKKDVENADAGAIKSKKTELEPEKKPPIEQKKEKARVIKPEIIEGPKKDAVLDTSDRDIEVREKYCHGVREKIKLTLEKNRVGFVKEGELRVRFTVKRTGALKNLSLYKSKGKHYRDLERIALNSVKEAAPFPPFNEKMHEGELVFKLPIRFSTH